MNIPLRSVLICALLLAASPTRATAQCELTTLFDANQSGLSGGAVYFDLVCTTPLRISGVDVNTGAKGRRIGLSMYVVDGGTAGNLSNRAAWRQVATDDGSATSRGRDVPSPIPFTAPVLLPAGSYGVALVGAGSVHGLAHEYTLGDGTNQVYSNALYTLSLGSADDIPWTGGQARPRVWNGTLRCAPVEGTYAAFSASPTRGDSPLTVFFTDESFTSSAIVRWEWDLDGDGMVDSNASNPVFTYASCGGFDVTLAVEDARGRRSSLTKRRFVLADPRVIVASDFEGSQLPGTLQVRFTDLSSGAPTRWSWDFDGDGVADSTVQHPTWTFASAGFHEVSVTAANSCSSETRVREIYVLKNDSCSSASVLEVGSNTPFSNAGASSSLAWPCGPGGSGGVVRVHAPLRRRVPPRDLPRGQLRHHARGLRRALREPAFPRL